MQPKPKYFPTFSSVILFLSFIFFTPRLFCQKTSRVDSLEAYFKQAAVAGIGVTFKGKNYTSIDFQRLIDSDLVEIYNEPTPNWKRQYFEPYYEKDKLFRSVIDKIENIKVDNSYFISDEFSKLKQQIINTKSGNERFQEFVYLKSIFSEDSSLLVQQQLSSLYQQLNVSEDSSDKVKIGIDLRIEARLYGDIGNLPYSLEIYMEALNYFKDAHAYKEIANTEEQIGNLYLQRKSDSYFKNGIKHYTQASLSYRQAGDYFSFLGTVISVADQQLYNYEEPTFKDIISTYRSIGKPFNLEKAKDSIELAKKELSLNYALTAAQNALNFYTRQRNGIHTFPGIQTADSIYWGHYLSNLFILLGDYFSLKNDWETSLNYFSLAIPSSTSNWDKYELNDLFNAVGHLARMFALSGNKSLAIKYTDKIIQIAQHFRLNYQLNYALFDMANNLFDLGDYSDGINYVNSGIKMLYNQSFIHQIRLQEFAVTTALVGFSNLANNDSKFIDSVNEYAYQNNQLESVFMDDFRKMNKTEISYEEEEYNFKIDSLKGQVVNINGQLANAKTSLTQTVQAKDSIQKVLNGEIDTARFLHQSLVAQQQMISKNQLQISQLMHRSDSLKKLFNNETIELNTVRETSSIITKVLSSAIVLVALVGFVWILLYKRKASNLNLTIRQADASSRNLSHNIKADYSDFLNFIDTDDFQRSKVFAESSAYYLGLATTKFSEENWTLQLEMDMLDAYYDVRKKAGLDIQIIQPDNENLNWSRIKFPSDVFTTLLHNFTKNLDDNKSPIFSISITTNDHLLYCSVSDNGIPSAPELYIRKDRPNKGLALLKTRIVARCQKSKHTRRFKDSFEIIPMPGMGTTIKFILPYETAKDNNS